MNGTTEAFAPVAEAFQRHVGHGTGGGALVVRMRDETVVDLCTGTADRAGRRPWRPDTLAVSFSTSKGIASTVIHRLADRGLVEYDEPVATYWPAFGAGGKAHVTVRELMSHRAGLWSVRAVAERAEDLLDHLGMEERLAARAVHAPTRRSAYHAITYGWLVAGLARAVTGQGLADLAHTEIAVPLGTDGLHIGVRGTPAERVAEPVGSALRTLGSAAQLAAPLLAHAAIGRPSFEALHIDGFHRLFEGPEPPIWNAEMPAVNGMLSAGGLAHMYAALANEGTVDGVELLSPETTHEIGRVQVRSADAVLGLQMRWRLGYHQGFGGGSRAFGHYGFGGSGGWADPELGLSVGLATNRVGSLSTPLGDLSLFRISRVVHECARRAA